MKLAVATFIALILGFLSKVPGLFALEDYAPGAYLGMYYSDIIALHIREFVVYTDHVPFVNAWFEYPVVTTAVAALGWLGGSTQASFIIQYLVLAIAGVLSVWALKKLPGANPWLLVLSPALVLYAGLNWDLLALAGALLACLAFQRKRYALSGIALAIGICAKLFPIAFLPIFVAALVGRRRLKDATVLIGFTIGVTASLNAAHALADFGRWYWFFEFNSIREVKDTVWNLVPGGAEASSTLGIIFVGIGWLAGAVFVRHRPESAIPVAWAMLLWMLFWNKVLSPQFGLFFVAALAVVGAPRRLAVLVGVLEIIYFVASFGSLGLWYGQVDESVRVLWDTYLLRPFIVVRLVETALLTGWILVREVRWLRLSSPVTALPDDRQLVSLRKTGETSPSSAMSCSTRATTSIT